MHSYPQSPGPSGHSESQPNAPQWYGPPPTGHTGPLVPEFQPKPEFQLPSRWRYKARRAFWENRALRIGVLIVVLAVCGLAILAMVHKQTGTKGFVVGMALALFPVPLLIAAFLWVDRVEPQPRRNLVFAFAWGACAATLVALLANTYAQHVLATTFTASPSETTTWGATFAAPFIEETAKGTAVLLLFLFRRRHFQSIIDGVVIAGITATGFAFTENILYIGSAFGADQAAHSGDFFTFQVFFLRVIMSPFAHPLFTGMTGVGFGIAAMGRRGQARRWLAPIGGWLLAMTLHGTWNGGSSLGGAGFLLVYAAVMFPLLVLMTWLAVWSRGNELRTIRTQLPIYAMAGWLSPMEPFALSSLRVRKLARKLTRRWRGPADARTVGEYQSFATSLAFLRARAARGAIDPDFVQREQELLHHLWQRRDLAQPALNQATLRLHPPVYRPWPPVPPGAMAPMPYHPGAMAPMPYHPGAAPMPYGYGAPGAMGPGPYGPVAPGPTGPTGPMPYGPAAPGPTGPTPARNPPPQGG